MVPDGKIEPVPPVHAPLPANKPASDEQHQREQRRRDERNNKRSKRDPDGRVQHIDEYV